MSKNKLDILRAYTQAWNDHDIDTIMSMMAEDCVFYTIAGPTAMGTEHRGTEQVRAAFESAWKNFPDAAWLDGQFYLLDENKAMSTSRFKGTDLNGAKHDAQMVDLFEFDGDKIKVKNAFRKNRPPISGE
ncbi:hypothetical protein RP300_00398 [Oligella urethralis]|uniref:nuclear transport factor 2 family protein n=1 Tax=Oligella urethralis TaxID=90245 RepID=UPI00036A2930|nr:nuclear transport factor 2 family protein [Oligella urethralis]WOS36867.1 hypothetical protein RP300_00398 [Oligella urethralis]SUA64250.1 Ketosteroid isomerase-related protein [Oligella urethralis]